MQWSDERFAGFTTGNSTWIDVSDDYHEVNVEVGRQCYVANARVCTLFGIKMHQNFFIITSTILD